MARNVLLLIAGYAVLAAALCPVRPLWTDEVLQLIGTRDLAGTELLNFVRNMPGQAPLGYLLQHYAIHWMGYSAVSARLVSVVVAIAAAIIIALICRELRHPGTSATLLLWMAMPLVLRYATEARPYSQALFFSALATLFLLQLVRKPTASNALLYGLAVLAGAYSVPYTLFPQLGYAAFLLAQHKKRTAVYAVLCLILASFLFGLWAVSAMGKWHNAVEINQLALNLSPTFPLLLVQEISGGGYACSVPLLFLAVVGYRSLLLDRQAKRLLLCGIVASITLVLVFDAVFHYYFTIRQILFILIPLVILAGAGAAWLLRQRAVVAVLAVAVFMVGAVVKNVRYYTDRSDDWAPAAKELKAELSAGYCLALVPNTTPVFYAFFEPSLNHLDCTDWKSSHRVVFPVTPHTSAADLKNIGDALKNMNFKLESVRQAGYTRLLLFDR